MPANTQYSLTRYKSRITINIHLVANIILQRDGYYINEANVDVFSFLSKLHPCNYTLIKVKHFEYEELQRAKNELYARGERISAWALTHGFSKAMVYSVLNGRAIGRHGQAHLIAIELGLKPRPAPDQRKD